MNILLIPFKVKLEMFIKLLFSLVAVIISFLVFQFFVIYENFDYRINIPQNSTYGIDNCKKLEGIYGSEDLIKYKNYIIIPETQRIKLNFLKKFGPEKTERGNLFYIQYPYDNLIKIHIKKFPQNLNFFPFSMKIFNEKFYLLNEAYNKGGERIDVFDIKDSNGSLALVYDFSFRFGEEFNSLFNNFVPIEENEVLITSHKAYPESIYGQNSKENFKNHTKNMLSMLFRKEWTYVWHCIKKKGKMTTCRKLNNTAAPMNNGITADEFGRVFVCNTLKKKIDLYLIEFDDSYQKQLKYSKSFQLDFYPDNINYNKEKSEVYIAGLIKFNEIINSMQDIIKNDNGELSENLTMWSKAILIKWNKIKINDVEQIDVIQQNNLIRGMSVMERIDNYYFFGSFMDNRILICLKKDEQ